MHTEPREVGQPEGDAVLQDPLPSTYKRKDFLPAPAFCSGPNLRICFLVNLTSIPVVRTAWLSPVHTQEGGDV